MSKITTISQAVFEGYAKQAIERQPIRKQVSLAEVKLVNRETLEVSGVPVAMSKSAFKDFVEVLRIPKAFLGRFEQTFGEEGSNQLMNRLRTAISADAGAEIVLSVNPTSKEITSIRTPNHVGITNEGFLGIIRDNVDRYNLQVSDFQVGKDGSISVNAIAPSSFLQVPGMKREVFTTGVSFLNSTSNGTEVSPFLMRMVCTNGMTARSFSEHYRLKGLEREQVEKFNEHMIMLQSNGFQPKGISDRVIKADVTPASLAEMQSAASALMSNSKLEWKELQRYVPLQATTDSFSRHGMDTSRFTKLQAKNAGTGTSLWSLVNGLTNFASNGSKAYFDDEIQRNRIIVAAGNMFAKDTYDTENLVLSPFDGIVDTGDKW